LDRQTRHGVDDRDVALGCSLFHPLLKLVSYAAQRIPCHRVQLAVRIEKPDYSLRLLKRLDQTIQQNAVEATVVPIYAISVVLVKGVHGRPQLLRQGQHRSGYWSASNMAPP